MSLEEHAHWYTPAHILGGWDWKLRRKAEGGHAVEAVPEPPTLPAPEKPQELVKPTQLTLF